MELERKQDLNALYQVWVFRADRKNKMAAWPLIGWDIFDFSSETTEWNLMKLDRKQDLNALYQVCVFRADRKKMVVLASDWLRHFWLLWRNRWTEFNESWQEASSQCLLPRFCFSGQSGESAHGTAHALRCLARSTQGRIQVRAIIGDGAGGGGFFKKVLLQTGRLQQQTKCIAMIQKHVGWSVVIFCSIPKSIFLCVHCSQVSDSGLLGLLFVPPEVKFFFTSFWTWSSSIKCLQWN